MKRNIINPDIALKLSQKAYLQASKEFNDKQTKLFKSGKTEAKTLNSLLLKDTHHQVFYTILKFYKEKLNNLSQLFKGSSNIMTHISPKMSMYVKTGRIAYYLGRQNHTIRERLRRLEKAGIIKVIFHGNKRPIEIIFDKETCLIFDKDNLEEKPKSKFLKSSQSIYSNKNSKKANNIEGTISGTSIYNITITSDAFQNQNFIINESLKNLKCNIKNTKKNARTTFAGTTKTDNRITSKSTSEKERKKVPQKKERKGRTIKEIREAKYKKLRAKATYRQMTDAERQRQKKTTKQSVQQNLKNAKKMH